MVIVCGVPQVAHYIASKVSTFLKQIYRRNQPEDELSDVDSRPRRLISPNQYSRSLLSKSEQAHANTDSEPLTLRGQLSLSCKELWFNQQIPNYVTNQLQVQVTISTRFIEVYI